MKNQKLYTDDTGKSYSTAHELYEHFRGREVWINFNRDIGEDLYSVQLYDTDFWIESFKYKKAALEFCKSFNLKIKEEDL